MQDLEQEFDVVIIGLGPVGAVAAALLATYGFKICVVERQAEIYDKPRAMAFDHEILRHFDNIGLLSELLPHIHPFTASCHYGAQGQLIRTIDMVPPPYPLGYTPSMVFTQPALEAALRQHLARLPNVRLLIGAEIIGFSNQADQVVSEIRQADNNLLSLSSRFLLGCDGASSDVRQLAGIELEDLIFDEPWLVVDIICYEGIIAKLPQKSAQYCDPKRPITYIVGPATHRRWEIMLSPGEDPKEMEKPESVWKLLSGFITPQEGRLWRAASYRFHALVAQSWRHGRVLIAGDAAHQQPPFIGQGMCQGLRDVSNLVWKLARVLKSESDLTLLDSYTKERRLHVEQLTSRVKEIGQMICERDPQKAALRDAQILAQGGGQPPIITRQEIIPPLEVGVLANPRTKASGYLAPQPVILTAGGEILLDKLTGTGWRLLIAADAVSQQQIAQLQTNGLQYSRAFITSEASKAGQGDVWLEKEGVLTGWLQEHQAVAALVRPDHYVFGTAATIESVQTLFDDLHVQLNPQAETTKE